MSQLQLVHDADADDLTSVTRDIVRHADPRFHDLNPATMSEVQKQFMLIGYVAGIRRVEAHIRGLLD